MEIGVYSACAEICIEGGAAADAVCCCFCHSGQPLTVSQRIAAAQRIAPRHDRARLAAVLTLVLEGAVVAERRPVEVEA